MEKSIETIWSEGFLKSGELLVPKVNNLYNQKSKLVIEKYKKTYRVDNFLLIPFSLLVAGGFSYGGHVDLGIYGMVLILALFFLNRSRIKSLQKIDLKLDSFNYLVRFRDGIKKNVRFYTRLIGIGTPVVILPSYWMYFRKMESFQKFISEVQPFELILIVLCLALFLSLVGVLAVKLDTRVVYGKMIKRMDEIISDMEELRESK
jgi:hypothetical protein